MLKQRVITACLMMLTFLATLFWLPPIAFFAFASAVFLIGAWEWSDLCGFKSVALRSGYVGLSAALGALAYVLTDGASQGEVLRNLLIFSCAWWALALLWVQSFPASALLWRPQPIRAIIGFLVIIPSWLSVTYLLNHPDSALIILLCLLIVAAVDVGAYFSGRRFGRRKLAPNVSPGKSWEGVWGGLVLSILVAFGFISIFSQSIDITKVLIITVPAALISIVGDLLESMMKRERGIKDSSNILPGHGGVLDRIDGMLSAVPVFALCVLISHWQL